MISKGVLAMFLFNFDKTVKYERKKGVLGYFQLLFQNLFDLVLLNFLFILTSLPVITFGVSVLSISKVFIKIISDEPVSPCKEYLFTFKQNFKNEILSSLCFLLFSVISIFSFLFYFEDAENYSVFYLFAIISLIFIILNVPVVSFYYPMRAYVELSRLQAVKNSLILTVFSIRKTLLIFFIVALATFSVFALFPYSVMLVLLFYFSVLLFTFVYITFPVIQKNVVNKNQSL